MKDQHGRIIDYLRISVTIDVICAVHIVCRKAEFVGHLMKRF